VTHGEYQVVGRRAYRGHDPGDTFEAKLDRHAELRAIRRGDIVLLRRVTPALQPGSYRLPRGWLSQHPSSEAPEGASFVEGG
jgi:hypothetical protein